MTADAVGGVWTYALELCAGLSGAGVQMILAVMGRRLTASERAAARRIPALELHESEFKLEWMENAESDVAQSADWLLELEDRGAPDLIHLNGYAHGALPWNAPCLVVGHSCVYSWFDAVRHRPPDATWQSYKRMVGTGLHLAERVTAPSRFMLSALRIHYGDFAAAKPIYNGRAAGALSACEKEPLILSAGRLWDEAKNIAVLAKAAEKIPWPIYAAGDDSAPGGKTIALPGLCRLGLLDGAALARWLGRAAIFAAPARYEPFGLAILEAAIAGCALVLGDIPSLREIWRDAALFVSPADSDEIAAALRALIENPSRRAALAARARRRAAEFSPERMTVAYLRLYESLLAEHGAVSAKRAPAGAAP